VVIAASASVILSLEVKKASKKRYWVRPSLLAKQKYGSNDLIIDHKRDVICLFGELRYE
jgi:hypothetical protein